MCINERFPSESSSHAQGLTGVFHFRFNLYIGSCRLIYPHRKIESFSTMTTIYMYTGPGADLGDCEIIISALQKVLQSGTYTITKISADEIIQGILSSTTAAFVMPVGFDKGFIRALGDSGATAIREYVWNGGAYLGLGAGAYYACDYIEFDKGGPNQVVGDRPLKFYPGMGIGPAYGPYSYDDERGARAAPVDYFQYPGPRSISSKIYFNGGNEFVPYSKESGGMQRDTTSDIPMGTLDKVLGVYSKLPTQPISIVKCKAGKGVAVLSGVQMETRSSDLDGDNIYLKPIKKELEPNDNINDVIWSSALQELGLQVVV